MPLETDVQDVCKEPSRADALGRSMNRHTRLCTDCAGTGFIEDGPDPRGRVGWCQDCQGLGWYAVITAGDILRTALMGGGMVAVVFGAMAIMP